MKGTPAIGKLGESRTVLFDKTGTSPNVKWQPFRSEYRAELRGGPDAG